MNKRAPGYRRLLCGIPVQRQTRQKRSAFLSSHPVQHFAVISHSLNHVLEKSVLFHIIYLHVLDQGEQFDLLPVRLSSHWIGTGKIMQQKPLPFAFLTVVCLR